MALGAPLIVAAISGALVTIVTGVVGRVLLSLGIGFVAYSGFGALFDQMQTMILDSFATMPVQVGEILGVLKIDTCVKLILAAMSIRMVLMGVIGGTIYRMVRNFGGGS